MVNGIQKQILPRWVAESGSQEMDRILVLVNRYQSMPDGKLDQLG